MRSLLSVLLLCAAALPARADTAGADTLRIVATVTSLGSLSLEVGGEQVEVTVFAKPGEDPHFVDPRPSFVRALNRADVLVRVGMDLERGWLPPLILNARNGRVLSGATGYIDASTVVTPLEIPPPGTSRLAGDVHPFGNPHYLVDPIQGLRVARLLRDRFSLLRPKAKATFKARYAEFERRVAVGLFGPVLADRYDVEKLARLQELGRLEAFLESQGEQGDLSGWSAPGFRGTRAVADHNLWPYFAERFGLRLIGFLEPKPGVPPSTGHLRELIEQMLATDTRLILAAPYFPARHAEFLAEQTGARIARVAHDVGAYPGVDDYVELVEYNVNAVRAALASGVGAE
jgi:ABC-type Zn uptake system ZnuABC Zn-binding protein ZnuA